MPHFFISSKDINNDKIVVSDKDNYRHIVKSLRAKVGEKLLLIDENEIEYDTIIREISNNAIFVDVKSFAKSKRDLGFDLFLAQTPLRSDAQNTIIEKATELGVRGVYPIYTKNCALKKNVIVSKIDKWQKIMFEASKQCERANIPTCFSLCGLDDLLKESSFDRIITLCERNAKESLKDYLRKNKIKEKEKVLIIIGPEGGFSKEEFELFAKNNLPMLSLGDLILKAETAVITTLGNIVYEYNE